jgi:hypothetical protein
MKFAIPLILALVFSAVSAASAQGAGRFCPPTASEKTTIAAIAADPAGFMGKCVSLTGIYSDERLYADVDSIYGVNGNSIGGYVDGKGSMEGFWTGQFTGRVADCAVAENELAVGLLRSPGISLNGRTLGCLEPKGPFLLFMSQRELAPAKLVRRVAPAKGDLKPVAADSEQHRLVSEFMPLVLAALDSTTLDMMGALIGNEYEATRVKSDTGSAIARLRNMATRPAPQIFLHDTAAADATSTEACYCLKKDCRTLWPIARRDADNQAERPYACVRVDLTREGETWRYKIDPGQDFGGLPEPAGSRMR